MSRRITPDLLIVLGACAAVTVLAQAAGAPKLGTAMSVGQVAFAGAPVAVLVKR